MNRFRLAPEACQDIEEILAYIAKGSPNAAVRVRQVFLDRCRLLAEHPYIGHRRDDLTTRKDVLFWPVYFYLIIYRPDAQPLEILRVLHGRRDVASILDR